MGTRAELQQLLMTLCPNVYFQPPETVKMNYPAIVFAKDNLRNTFANNGVYQQSRSYVITIMDSDPDSRISDRVSKLPTASWNRRYRSDGLYHEVYTINY